MPLLVAGGAVVFAAGVILKLWDSVREGEAVVHADRRVLDFLTRHRTPWLSHVARAVTDLGSGWVVAPLVVVTVLALWHARRPREAIVVVAASVGTALAVSVLKHVVGRSRPPVAGRLADAGGAAFPSGHAAQAVAFWGALAWVAWRTTRSRRTRALALAGAALIAALVGLSRLYLGVHWPSDVVSGWLVGLGWLVAVCGVSLAIPAR